MTRQDWRDLVYWCAAAGAFLTLVLLAYGVTAVVLYLLTGYSAY